MKLLVRAVQKAAHVYAVLNANIYSKGSVVDAVSVAEAEKRFVPNEFFPPYVLQGNPQMRNATIRETGDGGLSMGVWECTAGRFRWCFECDEVVHILEGGVTVLVEGVSRELVAGSVAFFPIGTDSEWTVETYVKKLYCHRHPTPFIKRTLAVLRRWSDPPRI